MSRRIGEFLADAADRLRACSDTPRLDAEVLLMHVCRLTRAALVTRADDLLSAEQQTQMLALLERRRQGEPVAYLTGEREFWSMTLAVTSDTLIPRPDTEVLVERTLALIPVDARWRIADLGTGSGAIALAIARERPHCHVVATDISDAALAVAQANALHHTIRNIEFRCGSWEQPLASEAFEVIVSNPPYIRADDPHLQQGDVRFEPRGALVAGDDGLDAIRQIARLGRVHLKPGGWLLLEHGYDQAQQVEAILHAAGYGEYSLHRDYAGHGRVSQAHQPG